MSYPARKQAVSLVRSGNDKWKMLEQVRQQRREEEEAVEKAKKAEDRVELPETAKETDKMPEQEYPVTRNGESRDLRI